MASVSAYPQSVTNDPATSGGPAEPYPWLAPGDAVAAAGPPNDGNCATVFIDFNGSTLLPALSQGLMSQQCGFSVPPGSTIDGIEVSLYMKCDAADTVADFDITLLRAGSRDAATTKSPPSTTGLPTSFGVRTFGGPADLWGVSWSPSDINDAGFGFDYAVQLADESINPGFDPGTVSVDYTEVTVYYSASPTGTAAGDSSASAVGAPVAHATFAVTGVATASGVAAGSISAGSAPGEASASGVGARTAASTFSVAGDSSAAGEGGSSRSAGTAPGEALAFGSGTSVARSVGMAPGEGSSIAEGIGAHSGSPADPTGIADGEAFSSFAGASLVPSAFSASGEASTSGLSGGGRWRWMPPGCSCCGTSPPPPPPPPPPCGPGRPPIPATITMTIPDGPLANNFPPCPPQHACWLFTCVPPFGPPGPGGSLCTYVFQSANGTFVYGPPPASVASAFPAGDMRWWNYTKFTTNPDPFAFGCSQDCNFYQYITWLGPGSCELRLGSVEEAGPLAICVVQDFPFQGTPASGATYTWTFPSVFGNTISPFFATSDGGGICAAVLT